MKLCLSLSDFDIKNWNALVLYCRTRLGGFAGNIDLVFIFNTVNACGMDHIL